jgi:hypothetical protein
MRLKGQRRNLMEGSGIALEMPGNRMFVTDFRRFGLFRRSRRKERAQPPLPPGESHRRSLCRN